MILKGEVKEVKEYVGVKGSFKVLKVADTSLEKEKLYRVVPANGEKIGDKVEFNVIASSKAFKNKKGEFVSAITLKRV